MNKGFTLIELIGVIVILSLLVLLASSGVTKIVKGSKSDINEAEKLAIIRSAEIYRANHIRDFGDDQCLNKTIQDLIDDKIYIINNNSKYKPTDTIEICLDSIEIGD